MDRRVMLTALAFAGSTLVAPVVAQSAPKNDTPQKQSGGDEDKVPLGQKIVERFAATLSAQDLKGFAALFADDYINHQTSAAVPEPPNVVPAKQNTMALFAARLRGLPDLSVKVEAMVVTDKQAAASFLYQGTHSGVYLGFEPTGRKLRFTSCDIFTIRDGQIAEHWGMGDIAGVLAQLKG